MSIVLGIDTSSTELGMGLFRDNQAIASFSRFIKNSHAEHITQAITMLLGGCNLMPADITHVAVSEGPGSFTGLRIGMAFIKGFCATSSVRVLPVSSLLILAHGAGAAYDGPVVAAIDARRDEVFCARFRREHTRIVRETDDALVNSAAFRAQLREGDCVVTDTMGFAHSTVFGFLASTAGHLPVERHPFCRGLSCAATGAMLMDKCELWKEPADVLPRYLRTFSAPYSRAERAS
jgi:tRNA threonylcarbamoyladenosine biosynthesis protein TsaB